MKAKRQSRSVPPRQTEHRGPPKGEAAAVLTAERPSRLRRGKHTAASSLPLVLPYHPDFGIPIAACSS